MQVLTTIYQLQSTNTQVL